MPKHRVDNGNGYEEAQLIKKVGINCYRAICSRRGVTPGTREAQQVAFEINRRDSVAVVAVRVHRSYRTATINHTAGVLATRGGDVQQTIKEEEVAFNMWPIGLPYWT
jgi:hypothetical protein